MKVRADTVTLRRDGRYLITYRVMPGAQRREALSERPVREGQDVIVNNGRVVR